MMEVTGIDSGINEQKTVFFPKRKKVWILISQTV